ncbi:Calcineurin-like phosphoesterase [Amycolatopsis arida]|uniref:Calcineurin-like phosphoesterase n=1 Tax=Amycolatopsis arida TaxID=587909 RepID=A0A1I5URH5_9PSEU|nr:phosphodiester glycosidase family protein [Amycolatopsis arida]TDX91009.1 calcineurin-like phosphoesterase family protein [Amycolatopsis arida]SFP97883.1 Calcineurin-like phosphoesterase [Amycolatopsis arida]
MKKSPLLALGLSALLSALVSSLLGAHGAPATADPLAAPLGPPPVEAAPPASSAAEGPMAFTAPSRAGSTPDDGLVTDTVTAPVAPGLTLTEFDRFDPRGWIRGDTLTVDLAAGPRPTYLSPGTVSARTPLSEQAERAGAVAGVNGDFFDINATGAPLGVGIAGGELRTAPASGHNLTASVTTGGTARLAEVFLKAEVTLPGGTTVPATNFNGARIPAGGLGVYTPLWGGAARDTAVAGADRVLEVELRDGAVAEVRDHVADGPIAAGSTVLLARDAAVDGLAALRPGDPVTVSYAPRTDAGELAVAVGGNKVLLRDGEIQPVDAVTAHPRTAVGFSADGRKLWLVTIDGRQADSRGMTELELARHLKSLGADDALNLDGGGSSTLLAREQGEPAAAVRNAPSDGGERPVPNGLGFTTAPGSGRLTGLTPRPALDTEHADRVLSGLSRTLEHGGHDETGTAVDARPHWFTTNPVRGTVTSGEFTAHPDPVDPARRAEVTVVATQRGVVGRGTLTVLGRPVRLGTSTEQVALSGARARGEFQVFGYDADGYGTWLEPDDVKLDYDPAVVRVEPAGDRFAVTAVAGSGATVITATAAGHTTHLAASVGSRPEPLHPLDGATGWRASVYPAVVGAALSGAEGRDGGAGLALDYRLTGTNATRAAYVNATTPLPLPAGTQRIGMWVHGDGEGAWLRVELRDAANVASLLDLSRSVDWTGWRYVSAALPDGLPGGQRLTRFYAVENVPAEQYSGRLVFDDLTVEVAPAANVPADPAVPDPALLTDGVVGPGGLRMAVVSDAQFTADNPDGPLVAQARRSLREAVAARPDVVVINGDFVDRGTTADFTLARRIITEELDGRVPWYYVPGNHEADGGSDAGGLTEFQAEFGAPYRVVDVKGVRLVLLDSSRGSLRAGGFEQVRMLREALDGAVADRAVRGVMVAMHHPVSDPAPTGNSQLADRKEAELLTEWLSEFEHRSGKPAAALAAHAGVFHLSRVDGVPYLLNGNAGKAPAAAPGEGGFTGWALVRVDPARRAEPVRIETRAHVDELTLHGPGTLAPGASARVTAEVLQAGRRVPVRHPVSADWAGGHGLHVVEPAPWGGTTRPAPWDVASFDPTTGTLTALRAGSTELRVTVNGTTRTLPVRVS